MSNPWKSETRSDLLRAHQRPDLLAGYDLADIAPLIEIEDDDR
jgi:hypothetical protein